MTTTTEPEWITILNIEETAHLAIHDLLHWGRKNKHKGKPMNSRTPTARLASAQRHIAVACDGSLNSIDQETGALNLECAITQLAIALNQIKEEQYATDSNQKKG